MIEGVIMDTKQYENLLKKIEGSTIALVYVFEKDSTEGFQHYDPWKSDVISDWLKAIQELHCMPFILDVRTFAQKALNGSLPQIDYIVNLNAGTNNLSTLGLVPSICSFLNIPCIPANTETTVVGEHKRLSNLIATALHSNVPTDIPSTISTGIFRPINYGSSHGVQKGFPQKLPCKNYIYQQFIPGFDMTIPLLYNPLTENLESLPPVMYLPNEIATTWFLSEEEKQKHIGYTKITINITEQAQEHFVKLAQEFGITTYCRIDTRVYCDSPGDIKTAINENIALQRINFIEINPLPTIRNGINFHASFDAINQHSKLGECITYYNNYFKQNSFVGFILASSIISLLKAKH